MKFSYIPTVAFAFFLGLALEEKNVNASPTPETTIAPKPQSPVPQQQQQMQQQQQIQQQQLQQLQQQQPVYQAVSPAYVPHSTYPYADGYGGYFYPPPPQPSYPIQPNYMTSLIQATQNALQVALKLFSKVGLYLMSGASLLIVGGIFTTAVCSLTPLCTISFAGLGGLDKESMRSLITPDRISQTAALVQDAIGKYQRLQRVAEIK